MPQVSILLPAARPGAVGSPGNGSPSWQTVVTAFLDAESDSPHTRRAYARHLQSAFSAVGVATLDQLTAMHLAEHRLRVTAGGLAPGSQAQALAALRAFLRWARVHGAHRLSRDVLDVALRMPRANVRRPYIVLGEGEVEGLLVAAQSPRDRALLAVLLGAGVRAAELTALDVRDLYDTDDGLFLHVTGKGRKTRDVPVASTVRAVLLGYLSSTGRALGDEGPLFRAHDRGACERGRPRLSTRAVGDLVATLARRAKLTGKRVTPHTLRHTYAIRYLKLADKNVAALQKLLGHASLAVTQRYLDHLGLADLRAGLPDLPGLAVLTS
jgi:site-specific recombinase XerC